jgi:NAD(P)-dependent dehydrogenase (short-subunit alcohol dehydrogenase family)
LNSTGKRYIVISILIEQGTTQMRNHAFISPGDAVIVTGAAGGIGLATVKALVAQGNFVYASDRNIAELKKSLLEIDPKGEFTESAVLDVAEEKACQSYCDAVAKKARPIRGLVNNAAIGAFNMSVETTSLEEWEHIIRINLTSLFLMSKYTVPHIRKSGGGAIVNVSSIHAIATSTGVSPYAAAKGGVMALTKTMALDYAKDCIRVVALLPGATDTPMLRMHAEREGKSLAELGFIMSDNAIGRIAQPEELADVVTFGLSRKATFVTGSALVADGGILAKF